MRKNSWHTCKRYNLSFCAVSFELSMMAASKIVGVITQSVIWWIRKMHDRFVTQKPDIATVTEVELDEMHHVFKKT